MAIRPAGRVLMMETMIFHDEVVPTDDIEDLPEAKDLKASDRELKMAQQLIDSLSADFDPSRYKDEYREKVLDLIERKAAGEEIAVQPEAAGAGPRAGPDGRAGGQPGRGQGPRRRRQRQGREGEGQVLVVEVVRLQVERRSPSSGRRQGAAPRPSALASGVHLEPDARGGRRVDAPAVGQLVDEHEAPARGAHGVVGAARAARSRGRGRGPRRAGGRRRGARPAARPRRRRGAPRWSPARRRAGARRRADRSTGGRRARPARRAPGAGRGGGAGELDVDHRSVRSASSSSGESTKVSRSVMRVMSNTRCTVSGPRTSASARSAAPQPRARPARRRAARWSPGTRAAAGRARRARLRPAPRGGSISASSAAEPERSSSPLSATIASPPASAVSKARGATSPEA